jgi:hypothetical protein
MEEQGIMGLPQEGVPPPQMQPSMPAEEAASLDVVNRARSELPPEKLSKTVLDGAGEADPREVAMFRQMLRANPLPAEIIRALLDMLQLIFERPQDYAAIRQELIAEGVPPDLLPPQLDLGFFSSLKMALYEVPRMEMAPEMPPGMPMQMGGPMGMPSPMGMAAPPGFKEGGIVDLKPIAKEMQRMGRGGDTILAHINPVEAKMLKAMGGSGTINPYTGLPEFIKIKFKGVVRAISAPFKAVGKAVKSVGKAVSKGISNLTESVKKFAKSGIGRAVTAVALGFFVGPAAANLIGVSSVAGTAAVGGFVGASGSSLLAGDSIEQSLKNGVKGAVTAGTIATVTNGMGAWKTGSYTGPTTISGQWNRLTSGISDSLGLGDTAKPSQIQDVSELAKQGPAAPTPIIADSARSFAFDPVTGEQLISADLTDPFSGARLSDVTKGAAIAPGTVIPETLSSGMSGAPPSYLPEDSLYEMSMTEAATQPAPLQYASVTGDTMTDVPISDGPSPQVIGSDIPAEPSYLPQDSLAEMEGYVPEATAPASTDLTYGDLTQAPDYTPTEGFRADRFPTTVSETPVEYDYLTGQPKVGAAGDYSLTTGTQPTTTMGVEDPSLWEKTKAWYRENISPEGIEKAGIENANQVYTDTLAKTGDAAYARQMANAAMPGFFAKYGPLALAGTAGLAGLAMATTTPPQEPDTSMFEETGEDLLERDPGTYGVDLGDVQTGYDSGTGAGTGVGTTPGGTITSYNPDDPFGYGDTYLKYLEQLRKNYIPPELARVEAAQLRELNLTPMTFTAAPSAPAPATFNMGGFVGNNPSGGIGAFGMGYKKGGMTRHYPRKTGPINGPGTGTSDSIPAMLSDGEFVFTAKAVRGMGNGSRREGAKKMYSMMRALERNA